MSMKINTMVLECSLVQLFCSILARMIHADILIQISMIPSCLDALTNIFDKINNLGKTSEFE